MTPRARKYLRLLLFAVPVVLVVPIVLIVLDYKQRPHAPTLSNDPFYQNAKEGFRFLAPEGWIQHARAELPPGKQDRERLLVEYQPISGNRLAQLEVSAIDLPASSDLAAHLAEPSYGVTQWRLKGTPAAIQVNGVDATRFLYTARPDKEELTREVVAFRRGERMYLFTCLYFSADSKTREELRSAVESTIWN